MMEEERQQGVKACAANAACLERVPVVQWAPSNTSNPLFVYHSVSEGELSHDSTFFSWDLSSS